MKVEVLYFDGCPNHEALLPHLEELLADAGTGAQVELVRVEDAEIADRERFLGSPTCASTARTSSPVPINAATSD